MQRSILLDVLITQRDKFPKVGWKPEGLGVRMLSAVDTMLADGVLVEIDGALMYSGHDGVVGRAAFSIGMLMGNVTQYLRPVGWKPRSSDAQPD